MATKNEHLERSKSAIGYFMVIIVVYFTPANKKLKIKLQSINFVY